jgi:hypothetical protein
LSERRSLNFTRFADVADEVTRLRRAYTKGGNWSLPQACHHLNVALSYAMRPGPYEANTPAQVALRPVLEGILASGEIPSGLEAPARAVPTADCNDDHIDAFLKTLAAADAFPGPFAPHARFGKLTDDEMRRAQLVHCAHHLGYLSPK